MKIAIPVDDNKTDICVSFGRTPYFMFYDLDTDQTEVLENPAAEATQGAGLKAAQFMVDQKVDVLITVRCGENAAQVMKAADIRIYKSNGNKAISNVKDYKEKKLVILERFHAGFHGVR